MKSSLKTLFSSFISLAIISSTPLHSREFEALRDEHGQPVDFEAINDYFGKDQVTFFASTDAESGSSGSPLFDKNGDVVGIVYATLNPSHAYNEGSTLAIPVQTMLQAFTRDLGEDFTHNLLHNTCTRSPDTDKIMQLILKI